MSGIFPFIKNAIGLYLYIKRIPRFKVRTCPECILLQYENMMELTGLSNVSSQVIDELLS